MATPGESTVLEIDGTRLTLGELRDFEARRPPVRLAGAARERMQSSVDAVERAIARGDVSYGINTGFGAFASRVIPADQTRRLQLNLVRSHACGTGEPLPAPIVRRMLLLKANALAADETAKNSYDVAKLAGSVDGVVVKTMKSEGIRESLRMIQTARAHDMQIMLSCMVESSVGVTAAAHLAPLCDYADLDGPLLIKNNPFRGLRFEGAKMFLPEGAGVGLTRL